jgi:RNA-directed DNA polymerase
VVHVDEGFDLFRWRIQRRRKPGTAQHYLYTYPSKKALLSVMARVRTLTRRAQNRTLFDLLHRVNPVLRGWATYFKHGVSKQTFRTADIASRNLGLQLSDWTLDHYFQPVDGD